MRRALCRGTLTALSAGLVLFMTAGPAVAHVGVTPESAEAGSWAKLTFRVPTERPDAATTKVEVVLPADQPLASLSVRPVPGWTAKTETRTLAKPITQHDKKIDKVVSRIVWTGGKINPGEFQEFDVSLGPLPEKGDQMVFKALQTYDSGEVVRWIDMPVEGGAEPEHPAPVLALTPAVAEGADAAAPAAEKSAAVESTDAKTDAKSDEKTVSASADAQDTSARLLGGAGLAAGLVGLLIAVAAQRRAGRSSTREEQ